MFFFVFFVVVFVLFGLLLVSQVFNSINDLKGDFFVIFVGSVVSIDLDVFSVIVIYNFGIDFFMFLVIMDGVIGSMVSGFYVWGVNCGVGSVGFVNIGIIGVCFDCVIILWFDGLGMIGGVGVLLSGLVIVVGNIIIGVVSGSLLFGIGFNNKLDYIWNFWFCDGVFVGIVVIFDFVLNNVNFIVMLVLEFGMVMLSVLGLVGLLVWCCCCQLNL